MSRVFYSDLKKKYGGLRTSEEWDLTIPFKTEDRHAWKDENHKVEKWNWEKDLVSFAEFLNRTFRSTMDDDNRAKAFEVKKEYDFFIDYARRIDSVRHV